MALKWLGRRGISGCSAFTSLKGTRLALKHCPLDLFPVHCYDRCPGSNMPESLALLEVVPSLPCGLGLHLILTEGPTVGGSCLLCVGLAAASTSSSSDSGPEPVTPQVAMSPSCWPTEYVVIWRQQVYGQTCMPLCVWAFLQTVPPIFSAVLHHKKKDDS